jgi:hypothetical protein
MVSWASYVSNNLISSAAKEIKKQYAGTLIDGIEHGTHDLLDGLLIEDKRAVPSH